LLPTRERMPRTKVFYFIPNLQQGGPEGQILELINHLPARFEPVLCVYHGDNIFWGGRCPPGQPAHDLGVRKMNLGALDRLYRVDDAVDRMIQANEASLRMMLVSATKQALAQSEVPARQNRRTPLIDAALAPVADQFEPEALDRLKKALGLVIGTEALLAFKDVLRLDCREAREVRRWMIRTLLEAAKSRT